MAVAGPLLVTALCAASFAFLVVLVRQRRPAQGVVLYSETHYGGTRAVLQPGTSVPPFQPASIFVPAGLQLVLVLTPGVNRVTVSPGSSVSVFTNVQPGTTATSAVVTAAS